MHWKFVVPCIKIAQLAQEIKPTMHTHTHKYNRHADDVISIALNLPLRLQSISQLVECKLTMYFLYVQLCTSHTRMRGSKVRHGH